MLRLRAARPHLYQRHHRVLRVHQVLRHAQRDQPSSQDQEYLDVKFQCRWGGVSRQKIRNCRVKNPLQRSRWWEIAATPGVKQFGLDFLMHNRSLWIIKMTRRSKSSLLQNTRKRGLYYKFVSVKDLYWSATILGTTWIQVKPEFPEFRQPLLHLSNCQQPG